METKSIHHRLEHADSIRHRLELVFSSESIERIDRHGKGTRHDLLDVKVQGARFTIRDDGRTFVSCSGEVIATFEPPNGRPLHLVLDDSAGQRWDGDLRIAHAEGRTLPGGLPCGKPRPSPALCLVQSA